MRKEAKSDPLRILIADDSPTARALLCTMFEGDPRVAVVGQARDGLEAVALTARLRPSVVILDIHMPGCSGLEATRRIMEQSPTPIVIISSTANVHDVKISLEALRSGALAICAKPMSDTDASFAAERQKLIDTVVLMSDVKVVRRWRQGVGAASLRRLSSPPRVVAIAGSTGAPGALYAILSELPSDFPAPILIVQHIGQGFMAGLGAWLSAGCKLNIKLAEAREPLVPGTVYIAPEESHLGLSPALCIQLSQEPPIDCFRPAATYLFQSVAKVLGARALGIILSGMGEDGVAGLRLLHAAGGSVLAQDQASSVIFGMPGAAIRAGIVDAVLSPPEIGALLRDTLSVRTEP